jgi:hypothetical protein
MQISTLPTSALASRRKATVASPTPWYGPFTLTELLATRLTLLPVKRAGLICETAAKECMFCNLLSVLQVKLIETSPNYSAEHLLP